MIARIHEWGIFDGSLYQVPGADLRTFSRSGTIQLEQGELNIPRPRDWTSLHLGDFRGHRFHAWMVWGSWQKGYGGSSSFHGASTSGSPRSPHSSKRPTYIINLRPVKQGKTGQTRQLTTLDLHKKISPSPKQLVFWHC